MRNNTMDDSTTNAVEIAILGGGCFWCLEAALMQLRGVIRVVSGYCGGATENPSYEEVCSGQSGHIEVVRIDFDPQVIPYRHLLEAFFTLHDPTTRDRQGNDIGPQYRSVIFTTNAQQAQIARDIISELDQLALWPQPIITELLPAPTFWPAEAYHQNYFKNNPQQPYCQVVVGPKAAKLRQKFAAWLK